jgi:hypothetical protein
MAVTKRRIKVKSDFSVSARSKRLVFLLLPTRFSVFLFRRFIDDNRERNALEAAKFLVDANNVYPTRFYRLLPKFLKFSLNLGGVDLPSNYLNFLSRSLVQTKRTPSSRQKVRQDAIIETKELPWQLLNPQGWKLLSLALCGFGLIRAGTVARNNCLKSALNEMSLNTASARTLNLAICGLLESRRFDETRSWIEKFSKSLSSEVISNVYGAYLELMHQPRPSVSALDSKTSTPTDQLFSNLIVGKNIALVAPGVANTNSGAEIDAHDTVVRIKFNGKSAMPAEKLVGKRCDITSHNSDLLTIASGDQVTSTALLNDADDLKLFIAKEGDFKSIGALPVRSMKAWPPTFLTTGTSGTLILFDLLTATPKKIKMYGFDFYTERQHYNTEILSLYSSKQLLNRYSLRKNEFEFGLSQLGSARIASALISHDLKSDFLLIKNLYELSGLIDGTPEVIALLNLTADEYDLKLEEMLGDW